MVDPIQPPPLPLRGQLRVDRTFEEQLREQWSTIVYMRWLAGVLFFVIIAVGTAETAILWSLSHDVPLKQHQDRH